MNRPTPCHLPNRYTCGLILACLSTIVTYPNTIQIIKKAILSIFALSVALTASAVSRPNIIIIYADDVGYGDIGCYGAMALDTPSVDRLASNGVRFTSAYATAATCTPS